jgi:hypothetical protein
MIMAQEREDLESSSTSSSFWTYMCTI